MEVLIQPSPEEGSRLAAKVIAQLIRQKPDCTLGLATGRTPIRLYAELIRMHREESLDFSQVKTFNLDEYLGLPPASPHSYHYFMQTELFNHINIQPANTHLPDGLSANPRQECKRYEAKIKEAGGIDLQVLGLGSNGHIGFNEPTGSLASRTWIKILSENTIKDNSALFENPNDVPRHCITMGIGTILEAAHCLVLAFGQNKAKAIHAMIEGPITSLWPASALQQHQRTTVILDQEASTRLNFTDHYQWIAQNKLDWQHYQ